jgi:hypothetical protein
MTISLAETLGEYIGDGWISTGRPKRLKISCDPKYEDLPGKLISRFADFGVSAYSEVGNRTIDVRVNNAPFIDWLVRNGLNNKTSSYDAEIPSAILSSGPVILAAFLRGLFEADGSLTKRSNRVSLSTTSFKLANQVSAALLSLGVLSRTSLTCAIGRREDIYKISILDKHNTRLYMEKIGFLSDKKNEYCFTKIKQQHGLSINHTIVAEFIESINEHRPIYQYYKSNGIPLQRAKELYEKYPSSRDTKLGKLLKLGIVPDMVKNISFDSAMTADLSVPENNTYIANGFVSHNTLVHGGSCIVISTSAGQGNWYHNTWTEAEQGRNEFNPIYVPWWEMDWTIRYKDDLTGKMEEIAPIRGIRETADKEEEDKYGKYWSPWLEEQYRLLQSKGEAHLFKQEILAEFIGTGNTVLSAEVLKYIGVTVSPKYWTVGKVNYLHPITEQNTVLDFDNQLRIWRKPVKPEPDIVEGGRIIRPGSSGHTYSIGMDISSGEADDYSAMVVVDCNTKEQVAELNIKILPADLIMMADYLGRWYNGAFIVPERTGLGIPVCQSLYNDIAYSNVFKMKTPAGKPGKKIGFPTSPAYKPQLNKNLLDYLGEDGVIIYSQRVFDQLCIYIHLGGGRTGHVDGPGNHSDLAIALALALVGITEAVQADQRSLIPSHNAPMEPADMSPDIVRKNTDQIKDLLSQGGVNALLPIVPGRSFDNGPIDALEEIMRFSQQMGGAVFDPKFGNSIFHRPKPVIIYRNRK